MTSEGWKHLEDIQTFDQDKPSLIGISMRHKYATNIPDREEEILSVEDFKDWAKILGVEEMKVDLFTEELQKANFLPLRRNG